MCDDVLDSIAEEIGTVTDEQDNKHEDESAREGEEFDTEDYERTKDDYDGGW